MYLEIKKITQVYRLGHEIYSNWEFLGTPTLYKGHTLKSWEIEMMFKDSQKAWDMKIREYSDGTWDVNVMKRVSKKVYNSVMQLYI